MSDADTTIPDELFGERAKAERQVLGYDELLERVSALMQSCEGCENVRVIGVTPLDGPDKGGCNWSFTLVLDTAGVAAEVYGLGYAHIIAAARSRWNLR